MFSGKGAREEAAKVLVRAVLTRRDDHAPRLRATFRGFEILSRDKPGAPVPDLFIRGADTYTAHINADNPVGTMQSIEHTLRALDKAAEDERRQIDDVSQMCHFLIVNTTQRSVDKAVEQQIVARLTKMVDLEEMPTIPRWIRRQVEKGEDARALLVANHLNTDPNSAWVGKIRMANDDDGTGATINQKSFVNSLKKYIFSSNNPLSNPEWDTMRPAIMSNYWKAVVELLVDEQSPKPSIIFKTTGVDLFHIVSATVFTHLANQRDFKKETIKKLLVRGFGNLSGDNVGTSDKEWWQRGGAASGLNSAAVRKLATSLNHAIHVQDNIGAISL